MPLQATCSVTIPGANKLDAAALAIEYWTSQGFMVHSSSYNCIVFRRNGYGIVPSFGQRLNDLFIGTKVKGGPYDQLPTELTVLCQALPAEVKWNLTFMVGAGYVGPTLGGFQGVCQEWSKKFADFCRQWMKNASD